MKKYSCILLLLLPMFLSAQKGDKETVSKTVWAVDSLFWSGYNNCTMVILQSLVAEDVEFYHDKGGITLGAKDLIKSIEKNICGNAEGKIRREAIPENSNLFLMQDGAKVYAAIISGDHLFYITPKGEKEKRTGIAKFMSFWRLKENKWQLYRVFSYEHRAIAL